MFCVCWAVEHIFLGNLLKKTQSLNQLSEYKQILSAYFELSVFLFRPLLSMMHPSELPYDKLFGFMVF